MTIKGAMKTNIDDYSVEYGSKYTLMTSRFSLRVYTAYNVGRVQMREREMRSKAQYCNEH